MAEDICPSPTKKCRILVSLETNEHEELNLSSCFNETYQTLMKDEIVKICLKNYGSNESLNDTNRFSEFLRKYDEIQLWFESLCGQSQRQSLCRSDYYLNKIYHGKQLLQSSKFLNLKMLGKILISVEPQFQETIDSKISIIENQWQPRHIFNDINIQQVLEDIKEDISNLQFWIENVKQKLNFDMFDSSRKRNIEFIEDILRDFEVHNEIGLSVIKVIHELQEDGTLPLFKELVNLSKSTMDGVECDLYQQWLKAIEYKLRFEESATEIRSQLNPGNICIVGQESGFESELSPMNNVRKWANANNNGVIMDISSGDNKSDYTTDLPPDSESAALSIYKTNLSSSTVSSSTETMPKLSDMKSTVKEELCPPKRIIRRKKRRTKRPTNVCQYNMSTEESEAYSKCTLKRRIEEASPSQQSGSFYSPQDLNYSELAEVAERLVRNCPSRAENSTYESPKESEIEDNILTVKSSLEDIDVDKNWDYYQAPMYSNEEGDSQIIEVDTIKDWEPETDSDVVEIILPLEILDNSPEKRFSMLTSGYETSMETDPTICSKGLICVLQFTSAYYLEVEKKICDVSEDIGKITSSFTFDELLGTLTECASTIEMHLKLIRQIICPETPCSIAHNTTLINNLVIMEKKLNSIKDKCLSNQLNLIENEMKHLEKYSTMEELKRTIEQSQKLITIFYGIRTTFSSYCKGKETLCHHQEHFERVEKKFINMKEIKTKDIEVVLHCVACVTQSKCTRKLFGSGMIMAHGGDGASCSVDVQEIYNKFESCIISLKKCMETLNSISSIECQAEVSKIIEKERSSWQSLCDRAKSTSPLLSITREEIETLHDNRSQQHAAPSTSRLFSRLPMHAAIVVVVAMLGWWYHHSSYSDCRLSSSSADWFRFFYRYKDVDKLEPH